MSKDELIALIKEAFADTVYPGDDNLTKQSTPEYIKLAYEFRGKQWKSLIDIEVLTQNPFALGLFKPEAFRYYLPAFMLAVLKGNVNPDFIPESLEYHLTPPETEGTEAEDWIAKFGEPYMDYWLKRVSGFTSEQKQAIKAYLEFSFQSDPLNWGEERKQQRQQALDFWQTFED